jgi:hypothetical protein
MQEVPINCRFHFFSEELFLIFGDLYHCLNIFSVLKPSILHHWGLAWLTDKTPETPMNSSLKPANKFAPTRTKSAYAD